MLDNNQPLVSDSRRKEIREKMQSLSTAEEYLDLVHNTIVWIHDNYQGAQLASKLYKIRGICTAVIQEMPSISGEWLDIYDKARDYRAQADGQLPTNYQGQVISDGAEVVLEEEEQAEYKLAENKGTMISQRVDGDDDFEVIILD